MSEHNVKRQYSKILVAVDGSETSLKAVEFAIDLVKNKKNVVEIIGIAVIELTKLNLSSFIAAPTYGLEDLASKKKDAEQWLNKVKELAGQDSNIKIKAEVIEEPTSSVGTLLVDYAEKENVDLIVAGTKGSSRLKKLLLGSTASHLVTYAHCPVLIVR